MDKYKNIVKIEQIKELLRAGKNEEALDIASTVDINRIKENFHFIILAKVFLANGLLSKAKVCYQKAYAKTPIRTIAMELTNLTIRLKSVVEAERYLDEFKLMAPNDYMCHIFKYKIDRIKGKPIADLIESLEKLKKEEFFDNWGFELAKLYYKAGEKEKCITTCSDVIIWFGEGEYVERAKLLRATVTGDKSQIAGIEKELVEKYGADGTASAKKLAKQAEEVKGRDNKGNETGETEDSNGKADKNGKSKDNGKAGENGKPKDNGKTGGSGDAGNAGKAGKNGKPKDSGKTGGSGDAGNAGKADKNGKSKDNGKTGGSGDAGNAGKADKNGKPKDSGKTGGSGDAGNAGKADKNGKSKDNGKAGVTVNKSEKMKGQQKFQKDNMKASESGDELSENRAGSEGETKQPDIKSDAASNRAVIPSAGEKKIPGQKTDIPSVSISVGAGSNNEKETAGEVALRTSEGNSEKTYGLSKNRKKNNRKKEKLRKKYGNSVNEISTESANDKPNDEISNKAVDDDEKKTYGNTKESEGNTKESVGNKNGQIQQQDITGAKSGSDEAQKNAFEKSLEKVGAGSKAANENAEIPVDEDEQMIYRLLEEETKQLAEQSAPEKKDLPEQSAPEKKPETVTQTAEKKPMPEKAALEKKPETVTQIAEKKNQPDKAGIERITTVRENTELHEGRVPTCIEMYPAGMLYGFLQKQEKTLEDYFGYFACNEGVSTQLVSVIDVMLCDKKYLSFCLECEKGAGRKKIVNGVSKLLGDAGQLTTGKTVWSDSEKVNTIDLEAKIPKLEGRCLVIDKAGGLEKKPVSVLVKMMKENSVAVVFIDNHKNIAKLLKEYGELEEAMLNKIELLPMGIRELTEYTEYRADKAGLVFARDAYELLMKQMKAISKEHSEAAYSYAEKLLTQVIDSTDERNAKAYIEQTLSGGELFRTDVITVDDIPQ